MTTKLYQALCQRLPSTPGGKVPGSGKWFHRKQLSLFQYHSWDSPVIDTKLKRRGEEIHLIPLRSQIPLSCRDAEGASPSYFSQSLRTIPGYDPAFSSSHSAIFGFFPPPPQLWTPNHGEFLPTLAFWQPSEPSSPQPLQRALSQPGAALQGCSSPPEPANTEGSKALKMTLQKFLVRHCTCDNYKGT